MHLPSVLIVDENKTELNLLVLGFLEDGFRVYPASSGAEALRIRASEIDAVVTTMRIGPVLTGVELAYRFTEKRPGTRVLLISEFPEAPRPAAPGGVSLLAAPFTPGQVVGKIRALLKMPTSLESDPMFWRLKPI